MEGGKDLLSGFICAIQINHMHEIFPDQLNLLFFHQLFYDGMALLSSDSQTRCQHWLRQQMGAAFQNVLLGDVLHFSVILDFQSMKDAVTVSLMLGRMRVQNASASDGYDRRIEADDEAVFSLEGNFFLKTNLCVAAVSRLRCVPVQQHQFPDYLGRPAVEVHSAVIQYLVFDIIEQLQINIRHHGRLQRVRIGQHVAPVQLFFTDSGKIEGRSLSRKRRIHRLIMHLDIADLYLAVLRENLDFITLADGSLDQGSCNDGAVALNRKYTIDRQTEELFRVVFQQSIVYLRYNQLLQLFNVIALKSSDFDARCIFQEGSLNQLPGVILDQLNPVLIVHHVALGKYDDSAADSQHVQNMEMLHRLRHDALIQRYNQQNHVDSADSRQHVADKLFMSRYVNDADVIISADHVRESVFNRNSALLLLFQAVCVRPGQRADQTGLSVIDVACCSDNNIFHLCFAPYFCSCFISISFSEYLFIRFLNGPRFCPVFLRPLPALFRSLCGRRTGYDRESSWLRSEADLHAASHPVPSH
jgi:hypothetical protein